MEIIFCHGKFYKFINNIDLPDSLIAYSGGVGRFIQERQPLFGSSDDDCGCR